MHEIIELNALSLDRYHCLLSSYLVLAFLLLLGYMTVVSAAPIQNKSSTVGTEIPTYMISTRNIFDYKEVIGPGYGNSTYNFSKIAILFTQCPNEVVIFVHGWSADEEKAKERLDRVKMSLEHNKYFNISLVGFSWGSDTEWRAAQSIAKWNGPRLADFIIKLVDDCSKLHKEVKIRLVAHSLGV